jgi:hypothetical protein
LAKPAVDQGDNAAAADLSSRGLTGGIFTNVSSQQGGILDALRGEDSRGEGASNAIGESFTDEANNVRKETGGTPVVSGQPHVAGSGPGQNGGDPGGGKPLPSRETTWQKLSNRIKALERNVSLSTGFLEELSLKYIKQIDELNTQLRLTGESIAVLQRREEACRGKSAQLERRLEELVGELGRVGERLGGLQEEVMARHGLLMLLEVLLLGLFLFWCSPARQRPGAKQQLPEGLISSLIALFSQNTIRLCSLFPSPCRSYSFLRKFPKSSAFLL